MGAAGDLADEVSKVGMTMHVEWGQQGTLSEEGFKVGGRGRGGAGPYQKRISRWSCV